VTLDNYPLFIYLIIARGFESFFFSSYSCISLFSEYLW
jgi:hypothetical protein